MGGPGSGRSWYYGAKDTTEDYRAIDIRRWHRLGLLNPGNSFGWQWTLNGKVFASIRAQAQSDSIILRYRYRKNGENWEDVSYPVKLDWTDCILSGQRPWFLCPAKGCGRRVAILYGGAVFACRHCHQLAYPSQRESSSDRATRKAERVRDKLGWQPGIFNGTGWKPKGMHWSTFWRLYNRHDDLVQTSLAGMVERLNLLGGSVKDWT